MASLVVQTIQGVPYWVDMEQNAYMYQSSPPLQIGRVEKSSIVLLDTWKEIAGTYLDSYRQHLGETTERLLAESNQSASKSPQ